MENLVNKNNVLTKINGVNEFNKRLIIYFCAFIFLIFSLSFLLSIFLLSTSINDNDSFYQLYEREIYAAQKFLLFSLLMGSIVFLNIFFVYNIYNDIKIKRDELVNAIINETNLREGIN